MQASSPGKLLLVEDNPDDEALMLRAIKKANVKEEIVVVRDGAEAVHYLHCHETKAGEPQDNGSLPRVVFLDLKLPRLDGLEVLKRIRQHPATRLLPVVILTTSGQEEDLRKSYQLGASSFVRKPLSYSELITVASHLVTYWLTINQAPLVRACYPHHA
jgi:two-component system, response regulator